MAINSAHRAYYRVITGLAFFLWCAWSSAAQGQHPLRHFIAHREFLGWSKDGRYAVWYDPIITPYEETWSPPPIGPQAVGDDCAIHLASVLDTRRGSVTRYLMDISIAKPSRDYYQENMDQWTLQSPIECANPALEDGGGRSESAIRQRAAYPGLMAKHRKEYAGVPGPKALRALLQGRPIAKSDRSSPDGTLRWDVEFTSKRPVPHKWEGSELAVGKGFLSEDPHLYDAIMRFLIRRGAQVTAAISVPFPDINITGLSWNNFTPVWSPDGRHLAIVYVLTERIKRGSYEASTAIIPTLGPKIALECRQGQLARAREVIGDALHGAGHSLLSAEAVPGKELTPQTLILALDGHAAAAQAIAALLPGGAEVRKQTALTSFHITIKLGESVSLPAAPPAK